MHIVSCHILDVYIDQTPNAKDSTKPAVYWLASILTKLWPRLFPCGQPWSPVTVKVTVMGQNKSKEGGEVQFIEETALAMGIQGDFIASKMELYLEYAAEDKLLNFEEFRELYKELSSDVVEDAYLEDYVKALFRAFDVDDDGVLSFKEWRLGYLLLLMLDKEGGGTGIKEEDWAKGMEAVYRIYDVDGDKKITKKEMEYITKVQHTSIKS